MAPQLEPLEEAILSRTQKQRICCFLEEALCNVGKHAWGANRLDVVGLRDQRRFYLQVIDDGQGANSLPVDSGTQDDGVNRSSQGSRQMMEIAQSLSGRFERLPRHPRGTVSQLSWPATPPLMRRIKRCLKRL